MLYFLKYRLCVNTHLVIVLLCGMVCTGLAYAPEEGVVHDLLDSSALNVAMFAMGWAATIRWRSGKTGKQSSDAHLCKASAELPSQVFVTSKQQSAEPLEEDLGEAEDYLSEQNVEVHQASDVPIVWLPEVDDRHAEDLLDGLSALLVSQSSPDANANLPPWRRSCFYFKDSTDVPLREYLESVYWSFECSSPCLVIAFIYIQRLLAHYSKVTWNADTSRRLFATSLLVALKFHDDDYAPYSNAFYAGIADVSTEDMDLMEREFCKLMNWKLFVTPEEYNYYHNIIVEAISLVHA